MKVTKSESNAPLPGSEQTDPAIPAEAHSAENGLNVGAIVPLDIPEEPTGSYSPEGQDTDFSNQVRPEVRKPEPFEKFAICFWQIMETILLIMRVGAKGYTQGDCTVTYAPNSTWRR